MEPKKHTITRIAAQLFMQKGYGNTSVSDIAVACNISKATIYKYFASKEEIGFAVVLLIYEELSGVITAVAKEPLSPYEQLQRIIFIYLEEFHHKVQFLDTLVFILPPEEKQHYLPLISQERFHFFDAFNQMLHHAFALNNEVQAWELTLNFSGILREIFFLQPHADFSIANERWTEYIMDSLKALADARRNGPQLFDDAFLARLRAYYKRDFKIISLESRKAYLFDTLRSDIVQYVPQEQQENYCEAIKALETEFNSGTPKQMLIDALCAYLSQRKELADTIKELLRLQKKTNNNHKERSDHK